MNIEAQRTDMTLESQICVTQESVILDNNAKSGQTPQLYDLHLITNNSIIE